jgi:hypothetical protein
MTSFPGVPTTVAAADTIVAVRPSQLEVGDVADALLGTTTTNVIAAVAKVAMLIHLPSG